MSWMTRFTSSLLAPKNVKIPKLRKTPKQCYLKPDLTKPEEETVSATFISIGIYDNDSAKAFIGRLLPGERELLNDIIERKREEENLLKETKEVEEVHYEDLVTLWWVNSIPFCGYGFFDNFLMIVVGESFDRTVGLYVGISIMGAAALGNLISNMMGIGLFHYVEKCLCRFFNLRTPALSVKQQNHWTVRYVANWGKVCGLLSGCILGMFPLLFYDAPERPLPAGTRERDESEAEDLELEMKENDFTAKADHLDTVAKTLNQEIFNEYEQFRRDWQLLLSNGTMINDLPEIDDED